MMSFYVDDWSININTIEEWLGSKFLTLNSINKLEDLVVKNFLLNKVGSIVIVKCK